jgi:hypothetical protein
MLKTEELDFPEHIWKKVEEKSESSDCPENNIIIACIVNSL